MKGYFEMSKMIGAIAVAAIVAATVAWAHSMAVKQDAVAWAEQAGKAAGAATETGGSAGKTRDDRETSDREYGWGPFRTVDW
jgi:hypothetical protein